MIAIHLKCCCKISLAVTIKGLVLKFFLSNLLDLFMSFKMLCETYLALKVSLSCVLA